MFLYIFVHLYAALEYVPKELLSHKIYIFNM